MSGPEYGTPEYGAAELREWFNAYVAAGFTEDQAMQLLTLPRTYVSTGSSPEMSEAMAKASLMFDKVIAEDA